MVIFACHQTANKVVIMSYSKAVIAVTGILPNCSEIPNSCTFFQFFLFVYILDMFADICFAGLKQFNNLCLRQPHGLILNTHLQFHFVVGLVNMISP